MPVTGLISCVMLTAKGRPLFNPGADLCFVQQTYTTIELVMVTDEYVQRFDRRGILTDRQAIDATGRLTVGEKRNLGAHFAKGEYIAAWDDDDWYSPDRLMRQAAVLNKSPHVDVVGLRYVYFTDGERVMLYRGWPFCNIGASFMYRRKYWVNHPFPPLNKLEDKAFIRPAISSVVRQPDGPGLYYATGDKGLMVAREHEQNVSNTTTGTDATRRRYEGVEWSEATLADLPPGFSYGRIR